MRSAPVPGAAITEWTNAYVHKMRSLRDPQPGSATHVAAAEDGRTPLASTSPDFLLLLGMIRRLPISTGDGEFIAYLSAGGLIRLDFPNDPLRKAPGPTDERPASKDQAAWERITAEALRQILAGRKPVALPPFDWTGHTIFRQGVWRAMLRIAPGQTKTYAQIAAEVGKPDATRATGTACGANPIPVLVPCHRVVAANGKLGGFSGGLDWKRRLLGREGVRLEMELRPTP